MHQTIGPAAFLLACVLFLTHNANMVALRPEQSRIRKWQEGTVVAAGNHSVSLSVPGEMGKPSQSLTAGPFSAGAERLYMDATAQLLTLMTHDPVSQRLLLFTTPSFGRQVLYTVFSCGASPPHPLLPHLASS